MKSQVFGGAFTIFIVMLGYFAMSAFSPSLNHSFSLSVLCGGVKFTIFTSSSSASDNISHDCLFVIFLIGAVILMIDISCFAERYFRYVGSVVSKDEKSIDISIPSHPACFARVNTLSSPYPERDRVERMNIGKWKVKSEKWKNISHLWLYTFYYRAYSFFMKTPNFSSYYAYYRYDILWIWRVYDRLYFLSLFHCRRALHFHFLVREIWSLEVVTLQGHRR